MDSEMPIGPNGERMSLETTGMGWDLFTDATIQSIRAGRKPLLIARYYQYSAILNCNINHDVEVENQQDAADLAQQIRSGWIRHKDLNRYDYTAEARKAGQSNAI
jgi:hypothetical protein